MASKSDKEKKVTGKASPASDKSSVKQESSKAKKQDEDDDDDEIGEDIAETPAKKKGAKVASKKSDEDDDEGDDASEAVDEWEKVEEEENWDPDFDEFDVPKSKGKKAPGTPAKKAEEEDEFKVDDEFKDMFSDSDDFGEEEDDY